MAEETAILFWLALAAYAAVGACLCLVLMFGLLRRLDPLAAASPSRVKAILAPGLIALWPVALVRLIKAKSSDTTS